MKSRKSNAVFSPWPQRPLVNHSPGPTDAKSIDQDINIGKARSDKSKTK